VRRVVEVGLDRRRRAAEALSGGGGPGGGGGGSTPGWVRFNMLRNAENPDEVICFGFFDGSVEELRANAGENNYAGQLEAIAPYVDSVGTDGLYEIVEEYTN